MAGHAEKNGQANCISVCVCFRISKRRQEEQEQEKGCEGGRGDCGGSISQQINLLCEA